MSVAFVFITSPAVVTGQQGGCLNGGAGIVLDIKMIIGEVVHTVRDGKQELSLSLKMFSAFLG